MASLYLLTVILILLFRYSDLECGAYLFLGARTEPVVLVNTPEGMNRWMQKIRSRGRIAVVSGVTDSLKAWSWKVGAHRRDPECSTVCVRETR